MACLATTFGRNTNIGLKIWHFLWGIILWTIWIEHNNNVFNQDQWHDLKVKNLVLDEFIIYGKVS